ncbi:DUF4279 domain-containing protein [Bacillus ndiopicus]|uniref:DUF4279 domain-containing protein n=1 Tax=Bacillus ndiopicus TaxID=1347368 RepID=UPI0005AAAEDF|nr:DUF4279 domain-containing protein [Bacillus ndiopicus]
MLESTMEANIYFCIYGDDFPTDEFTKKMEVIPTKSRKQGEIFMKGTTKHVSYTTDWTYETGFQPTLNPLIQLHELVGKLINKVDFINYFKKEFNLQSQIVIVVHYPENQSPGLNLDHKLIKFAYDTNSTYSLDTYCIGPSEDGELS